MLSFIFTYMGFVSNFLIRMQKFVAKHQKRLPRNCDSLWSNQLLGIPVRVGNGVVVFYISGSSVTVSAYVLARIVPSMENIAVVCFFR